MSWDSDNKDHAKAMEKIRSVVPNNALLNQAICVVSIVIRLT